MKRKSWNILRAALIKNRRNRRRNFRYKHFKKLTHRLIKI